MDCGSLLPLSGGQPAGRRVFCDNPTSIRSRVRASHLVNRPPGDSGSRLPQSIGFMTVHA